MNRFGVRIEIDRVLPKQVIADHARTAERLPDRRQVFRAEFEREAAFGERHFPGNLAPLGALARSRSRLHIGAPVSNRKPASSLLGAMFPRTIGAPLTTEYFRLIALTPE